MPRLTNQRTGVVVNVGDDTAARLRAGLDVWTAEKAETKSTAKKSSSSKSSK